MKQNRIKLFLAVVLAAVSIGAWADGRVVIGDLLNGTIYADPVEATGVQVVTLNVIPTDGYYIETDDIIVTKTTGASQARQETPGYAEKLKVYPFNVADNGKGTYQFVLPDAYGAYVEATFTPCIAIHPVVTIAGWTYGATANTPSVTGNTGNGAVTYTYAVKGTNNYSADVPVNAGDYIVKATIAAAGHYLGGEATASFTISKANMTVTATGYTGTYDGQTHGISVTAPAGATVRYGTAEGSYTLNASPTYVNTGTYTVYYEATQANYNTVTGSAKVVISKAAATVSYATTSVTKTYGDAPFTNPLTLTGDGTVIYTSSKADVATVNLTTGEVTIVGTGAATITASVSNGTNYSYATRIAYYALTVEKADMTVTATGFTGAYDGQAHGISVEAPEGATVKYGETEGSHTFNASPTYTNAGTYTVFYEVTKQHYNTVTGSAVVSISKAAGTISYATTSVTKTYGDTPFTNALTLLGDGTVTYASSDETVATVNATTGEVTIIGHGTTTITATVADGANYAYEQRTATYILEVETATMTVSVTGFTGVYDGEPHGIVIEAPEGATVKYGENSNGCTLDDSPTYTNAGSYTVYYEVTKPNFTTVTGNAAVAIAKAAGGISYETTDLKRTIGDEPFTNPLTLTGDGTVTYASADEAVAIVNAETGEVTLVGAGSTTITATIADGINFTYKNPTATYTLTVTDKTALNSAIAEAMAYYESIKDDYADIAATLKEAIDAAQTVMDNAEATQEEIDAAMPMLSAAVEAAAKAVAEAEAIAAELAAAKAVLAGAISEATSYYDSIKDEYADIAATLKEAIDTAQAVIDNTEATKDEVYAAVPPLNQALEAAKEAVKEAAGIDTVLNAPLTVGKWYDMNGRCLQGKPETKGIYIVNGMKVIIR